MNDTEIAPTDPRAGARRRPPRRSITSSSATPGALRDVSDTALWVAIYRAIESERPDALFRDPFARSMAGARGAEIVETLALGRSMAWSMVVRTAVMDEIVLRCVANGASTVLNLGAGLDARAFRLPLPSSLRWIDVDLPDMVAHRRRWLKDAIPACRHVHLEADISDEQACADLLRSVQKDAGPLLVVTEGLLVYLAPEEVSGLARRLHAGSTSGWWLTDLITPWLLRSSESFWLKHLAAGDARFRFAPADPAAFFEPLGWVQTEFRSTWDESQKLGRPAPIAPLWNAFGQSLMPMAHEALRTMSGMVLFERRDS